MKHTTLIRCFAFVGVLLAGSPVTAQIQKCIGPGGRVTFSDAPCASNEAGQRVYVTPNSIDASGARHQARIADERRPTEQGRGGDRPIAGAVGMSAPSDAPACPSDNEIRNMEVKAGSITLGKRERDFLQDEIRRARQCRKGQGNYTNQDWQISRDAQAAQGSTTGGVAAAARQRAEGMHSASDPIEGDRIADRRAAEEARRAARADAATRRVITTCDAGGCMNAAGERFNRVGNTDTYIGPSGACRTDGNQMVCP